MSMRIIILIFLSTFFTNKVFADDIRASTQINLEGDTSEALRKDKKIQFLMGLDGTSVGLFGPRDTITQVGYSGHTLAYEAGDSYPADWKDFQHTSMFLRQRKFVGNSLNLYVGLKYETMKWSMPPYEETVHHSDLYTTIGVGNQWQWKYLAVGIDWLDIGWVQHQDRRDKRETSAASIDAVRDGQSSNLHYKFFSIYAGLSL